jgi:tRNA-2-methylthio-N6-dimethylallyladenosine synthase
LQRALEYDSVEALDLARDPGPKDSVLQSYIRVQRGCDKFCTFCVVPFTRGPERSRPAAQIVDEAKMLADRGAKEVTLLGQTVNSYVHQENGRAIRFSDLLARINEVAGLERLRFVTSYPGDFTDDVLEAMRDLPKVCEYLHIPAQSGSDAVLRRMRRQYTVGQYVDLIDRAREHVPGLALASDFIVGFCGETEEEHQGTIRLIERCRFKNIFVFKYSPRPGTVADKRGVDDIPESVKRRRNMELLDLQQRISVAANQVLVGSTVDVLVEGYSKAAQKAQDAEQTRGEEIGWGRSDQLVGRTRTDQIVVFPGVADHIGRFVSVRVTAATALTVHGTISGDRTPGEASRIPRAVDRSLPILETKSKRQETSEDVVSHLVSAL